MKKNFLVMIPFLLFAIFSCQQEPTNLTNYTQPKNTGSVVYYSLPRNENLELTYYDNFCRPIDILLQGTGKKDSIIINNKGYTFLENRHSIREVWSILIKPKDTLIFKSTGIKYTYNSYTVKSLKNRQRTNDLNFYVAYNKWRKDNQEQQADLSKRISYWVSRKNLDSTFYYEDKFYQERINFARKYKEKFNMSDDCYSIAKNDFFAAMIRGKIILINKIFKKDESEKIKFLKSLSEEYSKFLNNVPEKFLNFHLLIIASTLTKAIINPALAGSKNRMSDYVAKINEIYNGRAKDLILLNFLITYKNIEDLNKYYIDFKTHCQDSTMITYLDNEMKGYTSTKNLSSGQTYLLNKNGRILSLDSLLLANNGKKILINFWASWCGPCLSELGNLLPSLKKYNPNQYIFIFLSVDDSKTSWINASKSLQMTDMKYNFLIADNKKSKIITQYLIKGFPTNLFFNSFGKMKIKKEEMVTPIELKQIFSDLN